MIKERWSYIAHCIEKNPTTIEVLKNTVGRDRNFNFYCDDCGIVIQDVINHIPGDPYGILYMDNNGAPNFEVAQYVSNIERFRHFDILLHLPATSIKRCIGARMTDLDLIDQISRINKKYWYIHLCHPFGSDAWQWVMVFGTNFEKWKGLERLDFFNIKTTKGESILNTINHKKSTPAESMKEAQKPLFSFSGASA